MKHTICFLVFFSFFSIEVLPAEILTWEQCVAEAKKNHPDLISAQAVIKQEEASKKITASALFPQLSAGADASTAHTVSSDNRSQESYSFGIDGTQLLFDGFRTINDIKAAVENIKASKENYRFTSAEVRLNLRTAFIHLLKAQELVKVTEEIVKIRRDNLALITIRYQSGLEHKGAFAAAEANLAEAEYGLSRAKRDIELAQRELTRQMGRTEFISISADGDFIVIETAENKPDFEAIARNNPSLLKAAASKNAARFVIKSAKGYFFPQVSARAGAGSADSAWPPDEEEWNVGVGLSVPIFEGGLNRSRLTQAKELYKQLEADERSLRDGILVELEKTWAALQDASELVNVRKIMLAAAETRSKIAEAQYSTGFITFDNWIIIENDLITAKKAYLEAQSDALLSEAEWIYAKGETLEHAQ